MKKLILTSVFFATLFIGAMAQTGRISCISYKENYLENGSWGEWTSYWTSFESENRYNPTIQITTIRPGYKYQIKLLFNGTVEESLYVTYDSDRSANVRKRWNNEYVNCYADENGDYIYTEEVSLQSLAKDPSDKKNNEDSKLYLMMYSDNSAVVV